jgi:hypothetical protein
MRNVLIFVAPRMDFQPEKITIARQAAPVMR